MKKQISVLSLLLLFSFQNSLNAISWESLTKWSAYAIAGITILGSSFYIHRLKEKIKTDEFQLKYETDKFNYLKQQIEKIPLLEYDAHAIPYPQVKVCQSVSDSLQKNGIEIKADRTILVNHPLTKWLKAFTIHEDLTEDLVEFLSGIGYKDVDDYTFEISNYSELLFDRYLTAAIYFNTQLYNELKRSDPDLLFIRDSGAKKRIDKLAIFEKQNEVGNREIITTCQGQLQAEALKKHMLFIQNGIASLAGSVKP